MLQATDIATLRRARWADPSLSWGFVPTMGALHQGHLELVRRSQRENQKTAVSIFVNPTQFNNPEDFEKYPNLMEQDLALLQELGVDLVFTPTAQVIYPPGFATQVRILGLSEKLEGAARPGHFDGVTQVVSKLFHLVEPHRAYFGQKDAQQLLLIQKMVLDLDFNLEVIPCPTVREADGLAMSSRNLRLNPAERAKAVVLYQSLQLAQRMIQEGERKASKILAAMQALIQAEPLAKVDYISINQADDLAEVQELQGRCLISLAVFFGPVRLIDNLLVSL